MVSADGLSKEEEKTAWNSIRTKFMGRGNDIDIFRNDISIKLEGNVTRADSILFNELIDQIKTIIPNKKIYTTREIADLIFNFSRGYGETCQISGGSIHFREMDLRVPPNSSPEERKKILYFNLYRSLVYFFSHANAARTILYLNLNPSQVNFSLLNTERIYIPGCVFDESDPLKITYSPFDNFILGKLYSPDFKEQYKNDYIKKFSNREYLAMEYKNGLTSLFNSLAFLCGVILLTVFIAKGLFKTNKISFGEYNRKGLIIILSASVCIILSFLSDLKIDQIEIIILLNFIFRLIIAINLMFMAEQYIFRKSDFGGMRIVIIFLITASALTIASLTNLMNVLKFSLGNIGLLPAFLTIALIRSIFIFLNDRYSSIINQKDVEFARISAMHKQAELQSLQAKINPHFLYNALNSIASLASTDAKKTEEMALGLSDFFKYSINREQKQLNSLSEELNAIRTYLEIEKVRFGERLSFEIDCPDELLDVQIPQLLIQPLVENAIKHGLSQITENGLIRISISREEKQLKIRIYDNGPAFPEGPLSGYGIQNTQERITLLYGEKASINWHNGNEKNIELSLPLEQ